MEEAEFGHLLELHDRGRDQQIPRPGVAEDLSQALRGAGRVDEPELGRGDAEDRSRGGDADIAGRGDLRSPPTQLPVIAAIVGVREFARAASAVALSSQKSASGTSRSAMSEPAEKCPPAPVITSAPIESSASTFAMICGSALHMGREMALRFSVRSMTRVPTPPVTVKSKLEIDRTV